MEPNLAAILQQALRVGLGAGQSLPDLVLDPRRAQETFRQLLGQDWQGLLQIWEQRGIQTEQSLQTLLEFLGGQPVPPTVDTIATPVTSSPTPSMDLRPLIAELAALSQDLKQLP